ncbi:unnamed protein product [Linum tenue]|uniref:Titin-like n=1 Tax=Linum tenue TaxID=586396 RepID=A0AAV0NCR3_9ROSI|nr:unnamed protein product [Linum tenue]
MASSEVEKITEPVSLTQEVEGVKSYLTPEVEAAVVSLAKSDEMLKLQHNLPDGNNSSISEVPEDESFLESSSSGIKVSGQDPCEKEQVNTSQADEPIAAKSCQVQHESIEEAGLDAVVEDRVSPGIEAAEQISTPEIRLVQNEAAASETCLENGSQDNDFSSGVEGKDLEPENEEANKSEMASSVENEVAEKGNVVLETGLQDEEKPADPEDVKDGVLVQEKNSIATEANEIAECAEEARISNDKPDEAMAAEAETMVEKTLHSESHEKANEQNEAAVETEKHIESESRELGEPAVAELVTMSAESETEAEKQEQVDEPDSKEGLEIHNYGASKEVVQTEEEAYDAKTPELETKSNHDETVNKEGSSKEITTVSDDDKVEEPVKENTDQDLQIDDQSARKEDIATPLESDVAEKENTGEIGVQEEEKTADFDDVRDNEVVLQEKTANATEANETAESAETKISDDKPDEAQKVESETVEKKPLHSESREEATYQQNEAPAEIENHIGSEPSAELVTKNGEIDDEKQEEIVQPESSEAPKVHHDAETSKEEEKVQTKEETSDAQKTELEPMSNEDDTVKELETNPTLGIDEALEKTAAKRENPTIHIVEKEVEIQKEEISKEDMKGDDAVDVIEEPVKEDTAEEIKIDDHSASKEIIEETKRVDSSVEDPEKNEQSPKVTLETPPQGEKDGQENDEKEEQKTEGVEEEEVPKKNESVDASEETITLGFSSPDDEKEEAEEINKETTETVDESSPPTQDHESCDSTVQTSVEKKEVRLESENIGVPVESNEKSKGVEEVEDISNNETSNVAEAEQLVIPVFLPESEGDSSSKLDHGVSEEKTEISEEDAKGDLSNEIHATDTIEQTPVEDLQKSEETVEHSNREVLEQSETAAEVESGSTPDETEQNGEAVVDETAPNSLSNHEKEQNAETKTEAESSVEQQMEEPVKEGIVADLGVDDARACKEIEQNKKAPDTTLETSHEGEKIEGLPNEDKDTDKGESKSETEEEVGQRTEQGKTVERVIEVPQVDCQAAVVAHEGTGEHSIYETEHKPRVEASEDSNVIVTLEASPEDDKKEEVVESNKETTETVVEPATATQDHGSLESESLGLEQVAEICKEAPETGEVTEGAEGNSSSKVDDNVQEKVDIPEEESHSTEFIEPSKAEDLQKDKQKAELASEEVLEQSETAAEVESSSTAHETEQDDEVVTGIASTIEVKTEVPETDEIMEKETLKGEKVETVLQEEKEHETRTSTEENPEELVTEHEITMKDTEVSGEIQTKDDKLPVVEKEVPEIIQSADEEKELENTMEDKEESTKEMAELVQSEKVVESVLGEEGEKEGVPEEKASVEPEAVEAIDTTQQGNLIEEVKESIPSSTESDKATGSNEQTESVAAIIQAAPTLDKETLVEETTEDESTMVEGTEKPLVASSATTTFEDSEGTSKEETIEEDHEERKQIADEFGESRLPAAGILESAAMQEEEVKGNVESVVAESEAIPDQLAEEKHVVQSSEVPSHEDDDEEKKQPYDEVCESRLPAAGILESAAMQEEEVKGNVESVLEESKAVQEQIPEEKHVVQSSEVPAHGDDYETKAVIENTEEEEAKIVLVSQPDSPHDPLELQTTKDTSLKEVQPRELESEASTENKPVEEQDKEEGASQTVEEQIKEASEGVEATNEDKITVEKSINVEEAEEQHQEEPPSLLAKGEEEKESSIDTEEVKDELPKTESESEGESCSQEQVKSLEDAGEEVFVSDEMDQKQEASDSTGNEEVKDDEVPATQALPEEPEVLQDEPKQTEEECKPEEVEKENQVKEIQEEVNASSVDITEENREIPEASVAENTAKQTEEHEVEPHVEEGVLECDKVQKGDDAAVSTEETKEVSALTTLEGEASRPVEQVSREFQVSELQHEVEESAITKETKEVSEVVQVSGTAEAKPPKENEISHPESPPVEKPNEPKSSEKSEPIEETLKEIEEASGPMEQVSREFQVSELEPEVEKSSPESKGSAITEETEVVSHDTKPLEENEIIQPENSLVEKPEEEHPEALETSKPMEETLKEAKEMIDEASIIKEETIVGQQKEGQEEKEESSEPASNFEFPGFIQPKELEQQVTTECPSGSEESKETAATQEKTVDISTVINKETLNSASEGSSQAVITKPVDNAENQPEGSEAELVIKEKEKEIIQESKPESEQKAERIPEDEIEPKESGNDGVSREKESIPSECDVKIVEEDEAKVKTEEGKAEDTTLIDKELCTEISQRDLPMELVEEATSEKQISTAAKPSAADETINPAKVSLFDMMAKSTRERQVVLEPTEEKEPQPAVTRDETKAAEAEPEKAKSDNEKENDEDEDQHKNDSGSDGMVIVEASKEAEVKVVTTPQKKSHNILSEVGSKVKHSISKVRKVITGKSSHQSKQKSPEQNSPK